MKYLFNTLTGALMQYADKSDKPGITFIESETKEEFLSYRELYEKARLVLFNLQKKGLQPGDEVVFQFQSEKNFLILFWACILGKILPVPLSISKTLKTDELKLLSIWKFLRNAYIVADYGDFFRLLDLPEILSLNPEIKNKVIFFDSLNDINEMGVPLEAKPGDMAFIQFSSGSTGQPKGVVNTHHALVSHIGHIKTALQLGEDDKFLSWLP
ncbi:MAG TPA: AMP-binding protein, partial [Candidatus Deferrimicrobium sp.]|nr:AMP-binding protein [Candidatus Deferrimicrobium sp.]